MCQQDGTTTTASAAEQQLLLTCDYLVVGAGTAGLSFIDTLLTEDAAATVILVDRNAGPGGHWTTAYPFVKLHQPSCNYGVNSVPLGTTSVVKGCCEVFDPNDRATGAEVVAYYEKVVEQFRASGRVRCFFQVEYQSNDGKHSFVDQKTGRVSHVQCHKVVTVGSNVVVPSMRGPLIPVHERVPFVPVNAIPTAVASGQYTTYVVVGAGKTGSDAVLELLHRGIDPSAITWIISRDVWYMLRDGIYSRSNFWECGRRLLKPMVEANSAAEAFLALEKLRCFGRLQPGGAVLPDIFKGPTIEIVELTQLQSIQNVVRLGRVVSIAEDQIILERGVMPIDASTHLVVDCMVDQLYGYLEFPEDFQFFEPGHIHLGPLLAVFNPSFTSAIVAYIETNFQDDDAYKNKLCFPVVGKYANEANMNTLFGAFYAQTKQMSFFMSHPPFRDFILNSRTNLDAPGHHGGVWKMLWGLLGPNKLALYANRLVKKMERGGYNGIDHTYGIGDIQQPSAKEIKSWERKTKCKAAAKTTNAYPPKNPKVSQWTCCRSTDAVAT